MTFTLPRPVTKFVAGEDVVALHRALHSFQRPASPGLPLRSWFTCSDAVFEPFRRAVARVELGLLLLEAQLVREGEEPEWDPEERFREAAWMVMQQTLLALRALRAWDAERPLGGSGRDVRLGPERRQRPTRVPWLADAGGAAQVGPVGRRPPRRRRHLVLLPGAA